MNTKISDAAVSPWVSRWSAAIDAAARVIADCRGHGMREKVEGVAEKALAAALPHLAADAVPVAWQYREDARHNGFEDDAWFGCTQELFDILSAIIGSRPFASVARGDGPWREDAEGWPTQVRALYTHPQPAALNEVSGNSGELGGVAPGITDKWVLEYLDTDAPEASREAIRNAFAEWNSLADADNVQFEKAWRIAADHHHISKEAAKFIWQAALAATGKQQGVEVDDRFPGGFADAIAYVNELEELAEALHEKVFGHESDGESGASTLLQMTLHQLDEKSEQAGEVQGDGLLGYVRTKAIKALREDDEVTGVMVHTDELADSVPVYLASRQPVGQEPVGYVTFRDGKFGSWLFSTKPMAENFDATAINGGPANSSIFAVYVAPPAQSLSNIATRKLEELASQGYVTNGVAIFNPATGKRGLVDNLGYVGWQGAQGIDLGQFRYLAQWVKDGCNFLQCDPAKLDSSARDLLRRIEITEKAR